MPKHQIPSQATLAPTYMGQFARNCNLALEMPGFKPIARACCGSDVKGADPGKIDRPDEKLLTDIEHLRWSLGRVARPAERECPSVPVIAPSDHAMAME